MHGYALSLALGWPIRPHRPANLGSKRPLIWGCVIQEDSRLDALRYRLVPSKLAEPVFWRRYFALVAQVRQDILASVVTEHDDLVHVPRNPECSLAGETCDRCSHQQEY